MSLNPIDVALQAVTPTVMVPRYEPLRPLGESGHRFLAARDGLWIEVRRPWLHAVLPVVRQEGVPMPYGWLKQFVELSCGRVPGRLVVGFVGDAMRTPDTEIAGGVIWNEATGTWRYERFEAVEASGDHIQYQRPRLVEGEHLVLDMHSHGGHGAFFSATDNEDDRGDVKLSLVVGRVADTGGPEIMVRLCSMGVFSGVEPGDIYVLPEMIHG